MTLATHEILKKHVWYNSEGSQRLSAPVIFHATKDSENENESEAELIIKLQFLGGLGCNNLHSFLILGFLKEAKGIFNSQNMLLLNVPNKNSR